MYRLVLAVSSVVQLCTSSDVVLSNVQVPLDTDGHPVLTGETSVLAPLKEGDDFFVYVNNWGGCLDVDCCSSSEGCASCCYVPSSKQYPDACVFTNNHSVVVYRTKDFQQWHYEGIVLSLAHRPKGIEFRPHVVRNAVAGKYVMWFENRPEAITSSGYSVATSTSPTGPFQTIEDTVPVADVPGDFDLLVDDDGSCWHVQTTTNDPKALTGFVVTKLSDDCTAPSNPSETTHFNAPMPAEGPVFFRRGSTYYILGGTTCCACRGGSSIYVFTASHPLGPWKYIGDVGRTNQSFDPHSATNYVTNAQASDVFELAGQYIWMGNQWVTSGYRNSGLLYWTVLQFEDDGSIAQVEWKPNATVHLSSGVVV